MKTIVVTGGAGFIGSHLAAKSTQPTTTGTPGSINHPQSYRKANTAPTLSPHAVNKLEELPV
jgi:hypothetical protein